MRISQVPLHVTSEQLAPTFAEFGQVTPSSCIAPDLSVASHSDYVVRSGGEHHPRPRPRSTDFERYESTPRSAIHKCRLSTPGFSARPGCAFVTYRNVVDAQAAIAALNEKRQLSPVRRQNQPSLQRMHFWMRFSRTPSSKSSF